MINPPPPTILLQDAGTANLAECAKPRDPCIRTIWTRHLSFP